MATPPAARRWNSRLREAFEVGTERVRGAVARLGEIELRRARLRGVELRRWVTICLLPGGEQGIHIQRTVDFGVTVGGSISGDCCQVATYGD